MHSYPWNHSFVRTHTNERVSNKKKKKERKSDLSRQAWISSLTISIDSTAGNDDEASFTFVCSVEVLLIVHSVYNFMLTFFRFFSVIIPTRFISNFANCLSIDRQTLSFTVNEHYIIFFLDRTFWLLLLVPLLFSQWYPSWHTYVVHSRTCIHKFLWLNNWREISDSMSNRIHWHLLCSIFERARSNVHVCTYFLLSYCVSLYTYLCIKYIADSKVRGKQKKNVNIVKCRRSIDVNLCLWMRYPHTYMYVDLVVVVTIKFW